MKTAKVAAARNQPLSAGMCEQRVPTDPPDRYLPREVDRTVLYRAVAGRFGDALNLNCCAHYLA
jgi:hypothetical protein